VQRVVERDVAREVAAAAERRHAIDVAPNRLEPFRAPRPDLACHAQPGAKRDAAPAFGGAGPVGFRQALGRAPLGGVRAVPARRRKLPAAGADLGDRLHRARVPVAARIR